MNETRQIRIRYMKPMNLRASFSALFACLLAVPGVVSTAAEKPTEGKAIQAAQVQTGESLEPFRKLEAQVKRADGNPTARKAIEATLIQMLSENATYESKAFACKQLAIVGGANSIEPLRKLLGNEQTTGIACIALGRIPERKVNDVLRSALSESSPRSKVQIINTLATRKDVRSLELFEQHARSEDLGVAESALVAIGRLGTAKALRTLSSLQMSAPAQLRPTLNEAMLACAESLEGTRDENMAVVVYNQLSAQDQPVHLRRAAFSHLVRLDSDSGVQRILEALQGTDAVIRPLAIQEVRNVRSRPASDQFVTAMRNLPEQEQASMVESLARRDDLVARAAVANAVSSQSPLVRKAALEAITSTRGADSVPIFLKALAHPATQQEVQHTQSLLASLGGGKETDDAIAAAIATSAPAPRACLITVLAMRQGEKANRILIDQSTSNEPGVRKAALQALSRMATSLESGPLLKIIRLCKDESTLSDAQAACRRALSQEKNVAVRSSLVRNALGSANTPKLRSALVQLLPIAADSSACQALKVALADPDPAVREAAFEAAADWPNFDAWDLLMQIYAKPGSPQERSVALRALARLASEAATPDASSKYFEQLLTTAQGDSEIKVVLGALGSTAQIGNLDLALKQLANPGVKAEASAAVQKIANSIKEKFPQEAAKALEAIAAK